MKTLITGATGKFGRIFVADRIARGDVVVAIGSRDETVETLASGYADAIRCGQLVAIACDLTAPEAITMIVDQCASRDVLPDGLVNAARNLAYLKLGDDGAVGRDSFVSELTLDVIVPYELTLALTKTAQSPLRRVINIGSQYGVVAANTSLYENVEHELPIHYSVAKAALVHMSRELAVRLAPAIYVNCISFGGVEGRASAEFQDRYAKLNPMRRMLREDEIAGPVDFLLSAASSGMTGHNLVVDGGWTVW